MQQKQAELKKKVWESPRAKKKVIFYNTTISALLSGDMAYLEKIRAVHEFFCEQDDVVLLWRPHPLNKATYQSMRPQLLNAYEQIIADYKQAGWGIYDDTPDLHRAIAISDAYYGDESSVVPLFIAAGKPVMCQNIHEGHSTEPYILPTCLHIDDEFIWFTLYGKNGLFRMEKQTGKSSFVSYFPDVADNGEYLFFQSIAKLADTLFFTPAGANSITTYNLTNFSMTSIPLKPVAEISGVNYTSRWKFHDAFTYGNKVFLIGFSYPAIICIDTLTGNVEYFTDWVAQFVKQLKSHSEYVLLSRACQNGSIIVAVSENTNAVLVFDMNTCKSKIYKIAGEATGWTSICFDGVDYWLTPKNDIPIVRWNLQENKITEYDIFLDNLVPIEYRFIKILYADNYIWLLPCKGKSILKINRDNGNTKIVREIDSDIGLFSGYTFAYLSDGKIYALPRCGNIIEEYDVITEELNIRPLRKEELTEAVSTNTMPFASLASLFYQEGGLFTIEQFISIVNNNDYTGNVKHNDIDTLSINNGSAGQVIYDFIKSKAL